MASSTKPIQTCIVVSTGAVVVVLSTMSIVVVSTVSTIVVSSLSPVVVSSLSLVVAGYRESGQQIPAKLYQTDLSVSSEYERSKYDTMRFF